MGTIDIYASQRFKNRTFYVRIRKYRNIVIVNIPGDTQVC